MLKVGQTEYFILESASRPESSELAPQPHSWIWYLGVAVLVGIVGYVIYSLSFTRFSGVFTETGALVNRWKADASDFASKAVKRAAQTLTMDDGDDDEDKDTGAKRPKLTDNGTDNDKKETPAPTSPPPQTQPPPPSDKKLNAVVTKPADLATNLNVSPNPLKIVQQNRDPLVTVTQVPVPVPVSTDKGKAEQGKGVAPAVIPIQFNTKGNTIMPNASGNVLQSETKASDVTKPTVISPVTLQQRTGEKERPYLTPFGPSDPQPSPPPLPSPRVSPTKPMPMPISNVNIVQKKPTPAPAPAPAPVPMPIQTTPVTPTIPTTTTTTTDPPPSPPLPSYDDTKLKFEAPVTEERKQPVAPPPQPVPPPPPPVVPTVIPPPTVTIPPQLQFRQQGSNIVGDSLAAELGLTDKTVDQSIKMTGAGSGSTQTGGGIDIKRTKVLEAIAHAKRVMQMLDHPSGIQ